MGSAGAKAMAVLLGTGDVYLHAGGQYEWDNCAPAAVALSAGLNATRLDGAPLEYNRPDPRLPDLLICPPALRSEEHTSELQSLMRISYAVFCFKKKKNR